MSNVTIPLNAYRPGKPAHETVTATAAHELYTSSGIDWPVSGDDTVIDWGPRGMRAIARRVNVWDMVAR